MLKASQFGMISFGCLAANQAQVLVHVSHLGPGTSEGRGMDFWNHRAVYVRFPTSLQRRDQVIVWCWLGVCMRRFGTMPARERERESCTTWIKMIWYMIIQVLFISYDGVLTNMIVLPGPAFCSKVLVLVTLYLQTGLHNHTMEIGTVITALKFA